MPKKKGGDERDLGNWKGFFEFCSRGKRAMMFFFALRTKAVTRLAEQKKGPKGVKKSMAAKRRKQTILREDWLKN